MLMQVLMHHASSRPARCYWVAVDRHGGGERGLDPGQPYGSGTGIVILMSTTSPAKDQQTGQQFALAPTRHGTVECSVQ